MRLRTATVLGLLACRAFYGQAVAIESKTITLTVSKNVTLATTDAVLMLNIAGDIKSSIEQVLAAVQDLGLTAQDLTGVNTVPGGPRPEQTRLNYQFRLVVPLAKMGETLAALDKLRRTIDTSLELQYFNTMLAASPAAADEARQRALPELMQEARRKAQSLADAAQMKLGAVQGVSEQTSTPGVPAPPTIYFSVTVRFSAEPASGS